MDKDAFALNISGVENLIGSDTNKVSMDGLPLEGADKPIDDLELDMSDADLLALVKEWENKYAPYEGKISPRQKQNASYLKGTQKQTGGLSIKTVPSNLLFEATATFVPQALAKNPEPVVFSDNTEEGKKASNDVKTVLQFLAMTLGLRKKLSLMVWHWGIYFTAVMKYGWDKETNQIMCEVRKPKNMIFDPDGYVDEFGDFIGWVGERMSEKASKVIEKFPSQKDYITEQVGANKLGTNITYTEWWEDDYCFYTFKDVVLDKHKNEFFNYKDELPNHFSKPKKPYTFLSVFSLQEQPHDFTNLIEQNIPNQDRINKRDGQIEKNLDHGNNAMGVDNKQFTSETAHQAANAMEQGDPILCDNPSTAVVRYPANPLPKGILDSQQIDKDTLRGIYGTQGLTAQQPDENTTARGMILNQSHDSSRIGGGMGDSLETVATSHFNWMLQLTYVFYDEKHYAAIMGQASAVEYVGITMVGHERQYVVSVSPNSMQPKDELTEMNQAIDLWKAQALDPLTLFKKLNYSDPTETAKQTALWITNPQGYIQMYFPEQAQQQIPQDSANPPNPPDGGQPMPPQQPNISSEPASAALSNVPLQ
jgi:hypothetical protein